MRFELTVVSVFSIISLKRSLSFYSSLNSDFFRLIRLDIAIIMMDRIDVMR